MFWTEIFGGRRYEEPAYGYFLVDEYIDESTFGIARSEKMVTDEDIDCFVNEARKYVDYMEPIEIVAKALKRELKKRNTR